MKTSTVAALGVAAIVAVVLAVTFIDVDQTQEARLPDVDVNVEGGQAPEFDVETGSIDIETEEEEVLVPKVGLEEETITVPSVEITPAGE